MGVYLQFVFAEDEVRGDGWQLLSDSGLMVIEGKEVDVEFFFQPKYKFRVMEKE